MRTFFLVFENLAGLTIHPDFVKFPVALDVEGVAQATAAFLVLELLVRNCSRSRLRSACLVVVAAGFVIHRPLARVPENTLKFAVGVMLSAFGIFWIGKASEFHGAERILLSWRLPPYSSLSPSRVALGQAS